MQAIFFSNEFFYIIIASSLDNLFIYLGQIATEIKQLYAVRDGQIKTLCFISVANLTRLNGILLTPKFLCL